MLFVAASFAMRNAGPLLLHCGQRKPQFSDRCVMFHPSVTYCDAGCTVSKHAASEVKLHRTVHSTITVALHLGFRLIMALATTDDGQGALQGAQRRARGHPREPERLDRPRRHAARQPEGAHLTLLEIKPVSRGWARNCYRSRANFSTGRRQNLCVTPECGSGPHASAQLGQQPCWLEHRPCGGLMDLSLQLNSKVNLKISRRSQIAWSSCTDIRPQDAIGEDFLLPYGEFLQRGGGLPGRTGDKYIKYPVRRRN